MEKEIKKVLVLGSGALKIGQAGDFERRRHQLSIGKPEHRNHSDF